MVFKPNPSLELALLSNYFWLYLCVYASCGVEGSESVHFSWCLHSLMCDEIRGALRSTLVFEVEMQFTGCCLIDFTCSPGVLLE
jgi:hypothetical protein